MRTIIALFLVVCSASGLYGETSEQAAAREKMAQQHLTASSIAAQSWLDMVDKNRYSDSWDHASTLMKRTVSKGEWEKILNVTRKPQGAVIKRTLVQQLPAQNPKNMPRGDYMVILYQTSFAGKPATKELLTLSFEHGEWRVITYMIDK